MTFDRTLTLEELSELIEESLEKYFPEKACLQQSVLSAARYSLLGGGKRIRGILTLQFCVACGGDLEMAVPFACAVEMIHAYSLIHDDLPCMDDDDMRRGKPSCHIIYGDGIALLAGDALLTLAFDTIFRHADRQGLSLDQILDACQWLSRAAGIFGMIGGQVIDIESANMQVNITRLKEMHKNKTGALIVASCVMGCIVAGGYDKIQDAENYGSNLGLAFQVVDDILDVSGDTQTLGKPAGSDALNDKTTFVNLFGMEQSKQISRELTTAAINALKPFGEKAKPLAVLARKLCEREK